MGAFLLGGMVVALVGGLHLVLQQFLERVAFAYRGASHAALSQEEEQVEMHQEEAFL